MRRLAPAIASAGLLVVACGVDSTEVPTAGTAPPQATVSTVVGVDSDRPAADQTAPIGTNGIQYLDGRLWIADLKGEQLVVADASAGTILARFGADSGVGGGPDDLVTADDGTIYWTAFNSGEVGHLTLDGQSVAIASLPPGANPIAWSLDGTLFVGVAVTGDSLYEIDPYGLVGQDGATPRQIAESVGNVNAFDVGNDGFIYGPSFVEGSGSVVRIDPATGDATTIADDVGYPVAARFLDESTLLVLSNLPATLYAIDLSALDAQGDADPGDDPNAPDSYDPGADPEVDSAPPARAEALYELDTDTVDNFAIAPDGTIFVTTFLGPTLLRIAPDGTVGELHLGDA